jgi:hypothetical protein
VYVHLSIPRVDAYFTPSRTAISREATTEKRFSPCKAGFRHYFNGWQIFTSGFAPGEQPRSFRCIIRLTASYRTAPTQCMLRTYCPTVVGEALTVRAISRCLNRQLKCKRSTSRFFAWSTLDMSCGLSTKSLSVPRLTRVASSRGYYPAAHRAELAVGGDVFRRRARSAALSATATVRRTAARTRLGHRAPRSSEGIVRQALWLWGV